MGQDPLARLRLARLWPSAHLRQPPRVVCRAACSHLVQQHTQGPDVGGVRVRSAREDLGRSKLWRSCNGRPHSSATQQQRQQQVAVSETAAAGEAAGNSQRVFEAVHAPVVLAPMPPAAPAHVAASAPCPASAFDVPRSARRATRLLADSSTLSGLRSLCRMRRRCRWCSPSSSCTNHAITMPSLNRPCSAPPSCA